ncbi:MAG: transporter substrate-binding domain-containing protein [Ruminococcaceae bacterium]|nr:transporter substrate-binding domain-containing protein [Oscillospiraceae bacterium]
MKKLLSLALALLMVVTSVAALSACGKTGDAVKVVEIKLTEEDYAFAVQKGNATLLQQLNDFMAEIKQNGKFDEIVDKYFGDGTPTAVTSAATMKNDGTQLIVATNAAFEPFEYKSGENYYGVDMEIMALFAQKLGKELYIYNMEFDAVCLAVSAQGGTYEGENGEVTVQGGICDVAAAGLTVSDERKEILDFSTTYYSASQMLIAAADDTTFDACQTAEDVEAILKGFGTDVKVGVQNGTTGKLYCEGDADWGFDGFGFTTVGYNNGALAVQEILNGNCKYVVIDEGPAKAIVAKTNAAN